jgi:hypothetical protein
MMAHEVEEFFILNEEFIAKWQAFFDHHLGCDVEFGRHLKWGYDKARGHWDRLPGITHIYVYDHPHHSIPHWMSNHREALCGVGQGPSYKFEKSDTVFTDTEKGYCPRCESRMRGFIKRLKKG